MQITRIDLGSVERIAVGHGHCFKIAEHEVAVFRGRDGGLFAIENSCPHLGGPLADGIFGGTQVVCPLHGHKFDCTTGKGSEASECVKTFKVWIEDNNIVLELGEGT